jgi:hypothetical protein
MKQATICLIRVQSCNALLRMLAVCICSYLIAVLRNKFLILDTYHPDTQYLCMQRCEDPRLFFEAKKSPPAKTVWETLTGLKGKGDDHCIKSNAADFVGEFVYTRKAPIKFICVSSAST